LKLSCGYDAWNETPSRCHRDRFCLWHRDWSLAGGREPCVITGICIRRSRRSAFADRRGDISPLASILARGDDSLAVWLVLGFLGATIAQEPRPKNYILHVILAIALRASTIPAKWIKRASFTLSLAMASFPFAAHRQRGSFELNVLDVGQGDSLFLVFPAGHTILVDGGDSFSDPAHRGETHGPDQARKPL
jgi:hypothetical protein